MVVVLRILILVELGFNETPPPPPPKTHNTVQHSTISFACLLAPFFCISHPKTVSLIYINLSFRFSVRSYVCVRACVYFFYIILHIHTFPPNFVCVSEWVSEFVCFCVFLFSFSFKFYIYYTSIFFDRKRIFLFHLFNINTSSSPPSSCFTSLLCVCVCCLHRDFYWFIL